MLNDFKILLDGKNPRKIYRMTCDCCDGDRGYQRKTRHGLGLCRICVAKFTHLGKIVSTKTKLKMKASNHLNNGGTHPLQGKRHSELTKIKISNAASKQNKNYLAKHAYVGPLGPIMMKSSWEVKHANWLDLKGVSWIYEPEFKLSNGYSYLPDFQLSTGDIIEIKGYMREDAQIKWDMFCVDYPALIKSLLRKDDLKKLGII